MGVMSILFIIILLMSEGSLGYKVGAFIFLLFLTWGISQNRELNDVAAGINRGEHLGKRPILGEFDLGIVLSITNKENIQEARMLVIGGGESAAELFWFMTGDDLFLGSNDPLPYINAWQKVRQAILKQHHELTKIVVPDLYDNKEWLKNIAKQYGKRICLKPL